MKTISSSFSVVAAFALALATACSSNPEVGGGSGGDGDGDTGGTDGDGDGDIMVGDGGGDGDGDGDGDTGGGGNVLDGCGDGNKDKGEECDDANAKNGDGCSDECTIEGDTFECPVFGAACEECGNGTKESTEGCDDNNTDDGDGCSSSCDIEGEFNCDVPGQECYLCGNGQVEGVEACDDENTDDGDGCAGDCLSTEPFFNCDNDGCYLCGDGVVDPGEACDDGNNYSLDGCLFNCSAIEDGFTCEDGETQCQQCGNGRKEGSEACDDRNTESGDGCSEDCKLQEDGYLCSVPGVACYECGNGVQEGSSSSPGGYEQCDDGDRDPSDGCDASCQLETDWSCPVPGQPCVNCGNGNIDGLLTDLIHEECDDGNSDPGDGCSASCQLEPGAVCQGTQGGAGGDCVVCGDGKVESGETCDDGNRYDRDGCSSKCVPEDGWTCLNEGEPCFLCGNGIKEAGEACDDANKTAADGCENDCSVTDGYVCDVLPGQYRSTCDTCGNGLIKLTGSPLVEGCDDKNTSNGDGCSSTCTIEGDYTCPTPGKACNDCGNGALEGTEKCDEGDGNVTAGCVSCTSVTQYWTCKTPGTSCTQCGNNVVDGDEKCDDGGNADGDGCRADCKSIESGWICPSGQNCTRCGNGVLDSGEECDDGNSTTGDGCNSCTVDTANGWTCYPSDGTKPTSRSLCDLCGNNRVRGDEQCDDGNVAVGDGCDAGCDIETDNAWTCPAAGGECNWCGSGVLEAGEICDEGEGNETAGCVGCATVTTNWYCTPGQSCTECGNDIVEGNEVCDDDDSSACAADCKSINPGWICTSGNDCTQCGNSQLDAGEQCDDGNSLDGDGCTSTCQWQDGDGVTGPYFCVTVGRPCELCGDGNLDSGEECDDGNLSFDPVDGCNSVCDLDDGWTCPIPGVECNNCGDGTYQGAEQCDDMNTTAGDGCLNCKLESGWSCEEGGGCISNGCGDGHVAGNEACDDGNRFSIDGCSSNCEVEAGYACPAVGGACAKTFCGDGEINGTEQCDNGGQCSVSAASCTGNSGCPSGQTCVHVADGTCDASCLEIGTCGDGVVGSGEECDDGGQCSGDAGVSCTSDDDCSAVGAGTCDAAAGGDGCDGTCMWEDTTLACNGKTGGKYDCVAETGCGDGVLGHDEECDDGDTSGTDGCSATCTVETFWECYGEVTETSDCTKTLGWVMIREFDVNSVNPEALHFDPSTRSFVGYKSSESQAPVELCIDGTVIVHPTPAGDPGEICEPGIPIGHASCTDIITTDANARYYAFDANSLTGATYDPASGSWYFLDSSGLRRICDLPAWEDGLVTGSNVVSLSGDGIAIADDGRLYVASNVDQKYYVYDRKSSVSGCDVAFDIAAGPVDTVTHITKAKFDGIFALSGMGMVGTFVGDTGPSDQFFRFFDTDGNLIASVEETDTTVIKTASGTGLSAITNGITGAETATDGSGFIMCFNSNSEDCKLFGQACTDDLDCERTVPGTVCRTEDDLGNPITAPYCWAPAKARDDYSAANTADVDVEIDVLANDTFAQSVCRGGNMSLVPDSTTTYGGTVTVGTGPTECGDASFSASDECLLYTPPSDGTCNIIDSFEYGSFLGGDEELFATVYVTVSCDCGNGVVDTGEACDPKATGDGWNSTNCSTSCKTISTCGNDVVEGDEQCDNTDRDICTWDCLLAGCGNGVRGGTEECDDGNLTDGDGCNDSCKIERCGNGIVDSGEECDNDISVSPAAPAGGDGCSSICEFEPECGDGIREGSEECDLGINGDDTDGCRDDCSIPICGDGVPDAGEQCDDGDNDDGDGCTWNCKTEACGDGVINVGEACDEGMVSSTTCRGPGQDPSSLNCTVPACGDTVLDTGEECDDTTGFCRDDCTILSCGDGTVDPTNPNTAEACDDGNTNDNDGCSADCQLESFCGDGEVGAGEECDYNATPGDLDPGPCSANCFFQYCGNGLVDPGEDCDEGMASSESCRGPGQDPSTLDCTVPYCGDGVPDSGEECDDGDLEDGDGCNGFCLIEPSCGNGIPEPGEECDNDVGAPPASGDGCSSTCELEGCGNGVVESPEECDPAAPESTNCRLDCTEVRCGDGIFDAGEQCDDGDNDSGDGCSATCTRESVCGDGERDPITEACDDGDADNGDGCSSLCFYEYCGNSNPNLTYPAPQGWLDPGEECDDGNNISGDGCSSTCKEEAVCGDGDKESPEQCDDGNKTSGDGCSKECLIEASCGDGMVQTGEQCDPPGSTNSTTGQTCRTDCTWNTVVVK